MKAPTKRELLAAIGGLVGGYPTGDPVAAVRKQTTTSIRSAAECVVDDAALSGYVPCREALVEETLVSILSDEGVEW